MAVKFEKNSKEWLMFQDFWKITQEFWDAEDTEEFWKRLINDISAFGKKYDNNDFALSLGFALIDELQRKVNLRKE